ncbi:hypothetical protein PLICRDRAFT_267755 [Plicaturopsis crispa FD-325 SS-3]|nr:hypothetical protein PLICRDRAFT_267755 [Plicaturopsis crispa FD-325 SS-3]
MKRLQPALSPCWRCLVGAIRWLLLQAAPMIPRLWKRRPKKTNSSETKNNHGSHLLQIPDDCIFEIMINIETVQDLMSLRRTCRRLAKLSYEHTVWMGQLHSVMHTVGFPPFLFPQPGSPASELERLVTTRVKLRKKLSQGRATPQAQVYADPAHRQVKSGLYHPCHLTDDPSEKIVKAMFLSPGWLLTVSAPEHPTINEVQGFLKIWNTNDLASAKGLHAAGTGYPLTRNATSVHIHTQRDPDMPNSFLVLLVYEMCA